MKRACLLPTSRKEVGIEVQCNKRNPRMGLPSFLTRQGHEWFTLLWVAAV
jgi:hypothetical protein